MDRISVEPQGEPEVHRTENDQQGSGAFGELSPIPEGSNEDASSVGSFIVYDSTDKELAQTGRQAAYYLHMEAGSETIQEFDPEETARPDNETYAETSEQVHVPGVYLHIKAANLRAGYEIDAYLDTSHDVELAVPTKLYAYISSEIDALAAAGPQSPYDHELVVMKINEQSAGAHQGERRTYIVNEEAIIERDTDLLTTDELVRHREEVVAATVAELMTWNKHGCFSRKSRRNARNIVDCKWVIKWKNRVASRWKN